MATFDAISPTLRLKGYSKKDASGKERSIRTEVKRRVSKDGCIVGTETVGRSVSLADETFWTIVIPVHKGEMAVPEDYMR